MANVTSSLLLGFVLFALAPGARAQSSYDDLRRALEAKIQSFDWSEGEVSGMVADDEHGLIVFERASDATAPVGALVKIFTAAAALETLGPDFRFKTELLASGEQAGKRLEGSLVVRGSGDPTMTSYFQQSQAGYIWVFDAWAAALKKARIREVEGGLVMDDSAFDRAPFAPGWPLSRLGEADLPEVSAINLNDNCLDILWKPGNKEGKPARCEVSPLLKGENLFANNVLLSALPRPERRYVRPQGGRLVTVRGSIPFNTELRERAGMGAPPIFFGKALQQRLGEKGIKITGEPSLGPEGGVKSETSALRPIAEQSSPPLSEIARNMLRHNRNLDAEALVKTLGARATGKAGTFEAGAAAVRAALARLGAPTSGMVLLDGSGLSALNRASAAQVMAAMNSFGRHPWGKGLDLAFPRAGEPGAMEARFKPGSAPREAAARDIRAIAGSARGAESLAGRARTRGGRELSFVFIVRGSKLGAEALTPQIDSLAIEVARAAVR